MNTTTQLVTVNVMVKKFMDWAISSQASLGEDEGSTTNRSNLDQAKRTRARGGMYKKHADDIVCSTVKAVDALDKEPVR